MLVGLNVQRYDGVMDGWLPVFGVIFLLASVIFLAWIFGQHIRRGWKDHLWIWDEANDRALLFAITFTVLAGGKWLRGSPKEEVVIYAVVGLGFVALPYIAYAFGRLLGIWHRARQRRTLS